MDTGRIMEQLQVLYAESMYKVALSIIKDTHLAEDIVQDAFIRVLKNLHKMHAPEDRKTRSFLFTITRNIALDYYRKKKNAPLPMDPHEYTSYTQKAADTTDDDTLLWLRELLGTMPASYRDVLKLKYLGYSPREMSVLLRENYDTVRKRLYRAQEALQERLKE